MAKFWLATFNIAASDLPLPLQGMAGMAGAWALEIIYDQQRGEYAVLFSKADKLPDPEVLQCRIGFANVSKTCSIWRDRGFPLIDAVIEGPAAGGGLVVSCPCFLDGDAIQYDARVIEIRGLKLPDPAGASEKSPPKVSYEQSQLAPDYSFPATWIRRKTVGWSPKRSDVIRLPETELHLDVAAARFPALAPLQGRIKPQAVWQGTLEVPKWPPDFERPAERVSRIEQFGPPAFQFEDVEVLGFRLNLDELGIRDDDGLLVEMIERLNYHLQPLDPAGFQNSSEVQLSTPDYHYSPATRTVMLELLRYGKMKAKGSSPPLRDEDYQSQHELLVRMLVGRIDDDTAQARDPATFVPAIFVDNPWSKLVGRNVQGFDKWMADFCVLDDADTLRPLRPDGRLSADDPPKDLASIRQVSLVTTIGKGPSTRAVLKLDCPYNTLKDWDNFAPVDLDLALGMSALAPTRWRQDDFNDVEFRRSFAREAIPETLKGFRSIQVSPIGEKGLLKTWKDETTLIRGTFSVQGNPEIVMPNGTVTLTLCAHRSAPKAWRDLCRLLGIAEGQEDSIGLTAGNWYRMRCSMELTVKDSFE